MKRLALAVTLLASTVLAACGGGGSEPAPPPPTGGFSNASLHGRYAFTMSGTDVNGFFARVGSITADGQGNITDGIEDVVTGAAASTLPFMPSTYQIQANGRGTIQLFNSTTPANQPLVFSITLNSTSQGLIVQTDGIATASGNFVLQNTAAFSTAAISGGYVFDFSGEALDNLSQPGPDSIVGQFEANGGGGITSGVLDENFEGGLSGPTTFSNGTFTMDATNGSTFGRGTVTLGATGLTYIYYIVDGTRLKMIEASDSALTLGDAVAQTGNVPTTNAAFTGNFAFLTAGASGSGTLTQAGRFTSGGSGALTGIVVADNDNGNFQTAPKGSISAATYAIDPAYPGTGRGTITFTDSSLGTFEYIVYMNSATRGVIQNVVNERVADGTISAQAAGPFTTASFAGNYALNWSGISENSDLGIQGEEDYVGQLVFSSASSNNVSGALDFNAFSSNQGVFLNKTITGNGLTINGDGTQANDLSVKVNTSPAATLNFKAFVVDQNNIYVVSSDDNRSTAGVIISQSQ